METRRNSSTIVKRAYSSDELHKMSIAIDGSDKDSLFIKSKTPQDNCAIDYELLYRKIFHYAARRRRATLK